MATIDNLFVLREVLAYDSLHTTDLTAFDRILIHQYITSRVTLSRKLQDKVTRLISLIDSTQWKPPIYRYREISNQAIIVLEIHIEADKWEVIEEYKR